MNRATSIALGEIMAMKSGSVDPAKFPDEVFDLYSIPAFDRGEPEVVAGNAIGSSKQVVQPGDVLLSKIVPHIRRSWVVGHERGRRIIASGEWIVFRSEHAYPGYLRHVLVGNPFHAQFMSTVSGVGGSLLRARPVHVAKIVVPLPPLPKQRRIAEVLDRAEALRAKRVVTLDQLDSITQSIFVNIHQQAKDVSTEIVLTDIAETTRGSFVNGPFGSDLLTSELQDEGVPVIYIRDIRDGEYRRVSKVCVSEEKARAIAVCSVKSGDILVAKVGDPPGISAVYPENEPAAVVTQDVIRIRLAKNIAMPEYVSSYLNSLVGQRKVAGITIEATRARFSLGNFKKLKIELPPISIQREFTNHIAAVEKLKTVNRSSLAELDALFAAIQHRAFQGEL